MDTNIKYVLKLKSVTYCGTFIQKCWYLAVWESGCCTYQLQDIFGTHILPWMFFKLSHLNCISSFKSVKLTSPALDCCYSSKCKECCLRAKPAEKIFFRASAKSLHPDRLLTLTPYYCSAVGNQKEFRGCWGCLFLVSPTKLHKITPCFVKTPFVISCSLFMYIINSTFYQSVSFPCLPIEEEEDCEN